MESEIILIREERLRRVEKLYKDYERINEPIHLWDDVFINNLRNRLKCNIESSLSLRSDNIWDILNHYQKIGILIEQFDIRLKKEQSE